MFFTEPFTQHSGSAGHSRTDMDNLEQLRKEPWFHGPISRADAERLLQRDGDFLVRESTNTPGQFVLSGMQDNNKKHLLLIDPEGVVSNYLPLFFHQYYNILCCYRSGPKIECLIV